MAVLLGSEFAIESQIGRVHVNVEVQSRNASTTGSKRPPGLDTGSRPSNLGRRGVGDAVMWLAYRPITMGLSWREQMMIRIEPKIIGVTPMPDDEWIVVGLG